MPLIPDRDSLANPLFEGGAHNLLLYLVIIGFVFFCYAVLDAWRTELDVRIVDRETVCAQPLNNRCRYQYTVTLPDKKSAKLTGSGFFFDPDDWVVGNLIRKNRFSFVYAVNGKEKIWPFVSNFIGLLFCNILAFRLWLSPRVRLKIKALLR